MSFDDQQLLGEADRILPDAIALRRRIHAAPELGLELPETQSAVLDALAGLDLEIETGMAESGVVATLAGGRPGRTILLRADMDALPLQEDTGLEFASKHAGRMHACGHDAHVAMLAGAARLLAAQRDQLPGRIRFVFQPGEEGFGGARIMIDEGLLAEPTRPEAAFAIHVDPTLPSGTVATRPGALLAATDIFSIEIEGKGGHASMPHDAIDPIPVACEIVLALQTLVTRRVHAFDPAVLTVTQVHAGTTHNIIPSSAQIVGTFRTVSRRTRDVVRAGVQRVAEGIARAHELRARTHLLEGYPVTLNDAPFVAFTREVASELLGASAVSEMPAPMMGGEDFSYILEEVPGAMVFLGVGPPEGGGAPLHSNHMVVEESAMATGIALHAAVARRFLEQAAPPGRAVGLA